MGARGFVGLGIVLLSLLASCSSATPEERLAGDLCTVFEDYVSQDEDTKSVLAVQEEVERLQLRGTADGVNFEQVEAKVQLDCPDPLAVLFRDQQELVDILSDINEELDLDS